jgi:hypothetical protein
MRLFNRGNRNLGQIWRALPLRATLFVGSAAIVALAVSYIAAMAGF